MANGNWRTLLFAGSALACFGIQAAHGQYVPSWWVDPVAPVLDPAKPQDHFAPATTGQLKWMATQAKRHLDNTLSGGAGSAVNAIVNEFKPKAGVTYTQAQLDQIYKENLSPVNLGQIKAVAEPFYARLNAVGYNTNLNLIANGYSPLWAHSRPWNSQTMVPVAENYRIANSGQLKLVFSFDIVDSNGNGTLDYLEGIYPASSPTRDTDGDGVPDIEDAYPNDPTRSANLVYDPNDTTAPTILTLSQPPGATLLP